jgi:para-nitrobenzyl esterase
MTGPLRRLLLATAAGLCLPAAAAEPTIAIDGGRIAVAAPDAAGVIRYQGLPYAAPPVGPLRWRAPAAVVPWQGIRKADQFAPDCMQLPSDASPASRPRSEDCLALNIWTTATGPAKRPVFVWFHGGGSRVGSGAQPEFDGAALAGQGIVVVTVNYRLGPFGFLSLPALSRESGYGASGNYGFMDDIAALRWVQRNIASFGGDPRRVTIGGESSGSVTGSTLMASPLAKGLFQQVIGESGSAFRVAEYGSMGATSLAADEQKGAKLISALGVTTMAQLRAVPAEDILAAVNKLGVNYNLPVVDGHVLPDSPWRIFAQHRQNDVALLAGWNAQEGSLQLLAPRQRLSALLKGYYGAAADKIAPYYAPLSDDDLRAYIAAAGDNGIAYPTWKWGYAQTRFGTRPVYLYEFDHAPPIPAGKFGPHFDVKLAGAFHGGEIPYVFDTLAAKPDWAITADDRHIAAIMSRYWANFIKTGNPNGPGLAEWPRYRPDHGPRRMRIGTVSRAEPDPDYARYLAIKAAHDRIDPVDPLPPVANR